jgi:hypothetical protein
LLAFWLLPFTVPPGYLLLPPLTLPLLPVLPTYLPHRYHHTHCAHNCWCHYHTVLPTHATALFNTLFSLGGLVYFYYAPRALPRWPLFYALDLRYSHAMFLF